MSNSAFTVTGTSQNITFPITVPQGGSGDTSFTPYAVITGGTSSTSPLQNVSGLGTLGQVLTSQGAGALPQWTTISTSGFVVNRVSNVNSSAITSVNPPVLPNNNNGLGNLTNLPLNTDGFQVMTLAITPTNANHVLVIEASVIYTTNGASGQSSLALFQDNIVNSLACVGIRNNSQINNTPDTIYIRWIMSAGTTSPTTFKVRMGNSIASGGGGGITFYVNQIFSNAVGGTSLLYGGVSAGTWMMITEYTS